MAGLLTPPQADAVAAELHRWAAEPFDLERGNCGLSVLDYAARATDSTVPAWLRAFGRVGAYRLMRSERAFLSVADRALTEMGLCPAPVPVRGDIGLVRLPGTGLTACICTGPLWAARGDRAAVMTPGEVLKAWRVPCRLRS